ncbi:MAG: flavodoxin family protein [Oscillospiraceae bacterium]|nr:flavodoxin family protein [Oscillospiraceae bacterium]
MKVLLLNGSTRKNGCTWLALSEVAKALQEDGVETEIVQLGAGPVRDCIGCNSCQSKGQCVFEDDAVNEWLDKAKDADGFIFGSPVYYAHPAGHFLAALDRMFYAGGSYFQHKPGAAIVTARRAGTTASLDVLNKYFTDAQMPVVSSTYWNMVHGPAPELVGQDLEGLQTMRNLGRNMAWLLKCIQAGNQQGVTPPVAETAQWTNFNR